MVLGQNASVHLSEGIKLPPELKIQEKVPAASPRGEPKMSVFAKQAAVPDVIMATSEGC